MGLLGGDGGARTGLFGGASLAGGADPQTRAGYLELEWETASGTWHDVSDDDLTIGQEVSGDGCIVRVIGFGDAGAPAYQLATGAPTPGPAMIEVTESDPHTLTVGPAEIRLTAHDERMGAPYHVALPAGVIGLEMAGVDGDGEGAITVTPPGGVAVPLTLGQGQDATVGGVVIEVVRVWRMPDPANDAIDVQLSLVASSGAGT
jgi:hypothetical protein